MALGIKLNAVQNAKLKAPKLNTIIANPNHSIISPKWFGHEIYLNIPPWGIWYSLFSLRNEINLLSEDLLIYIPVKKTISPINVLMPKSSCDIFPISYPTKKPLNKLKMNALITITTAVLVIISFGLKA